MSQPVVVGASIVQLRGGKLDEPCIEVRKFRRVDECGEAIFDRWCYIHDHWLNDAPPQKDVATKMIGDLVEWHRLHPKGWR
jgi:hypothetical protein